MDFCYYSLLKDSDCNVLLNHLFLFIQKYNKSLPNKHSKRQKFGTNSFLQKSLDTSILIDICKYK